MSKMFSKNQTSFYFRSFVLICVLALMNIGKKSQTTVPGTAKFVPDTFKTCILPGAAFAPSNRGDYCMLSLSSGPQQESHVPEKYCIFNKNGQCKSN